MQQPAESSADAQPHIPSPRADRAAPSPEAEPAGLSEDRAGQSEDRAGQSEDRAGQSSEDGAGRSEDRAGLSEREKQILAFEAKWWKHAGSKEQAIRDTFGLSSTRYYQLLNALLDNPLAVAQDPVLVGRLRRLRSTRARSRRR